MKKTSIFLYGIFLLFSANAQDKFYTKTGKISFNASTPMENIEAVNKSAVALLDIKSGELQFSILMKGFEFRKALMQEHFNNDYVESHKYTKSEFKGHVVNSTEINYSKEGIYPAKVKGKLTIHGETKDIEAAGTITVKDGNLTAFSSFSIPLEDYKITVPRMVRDYISRSIKITVECLLQSLKN